jgi:iron complex transport system ATP-binding protein
VTAVLSFEGVSVGYDRRIILRDLTLDVRAAEVLAVVGPNGVGKSTLIRSASGVLPLPSGRVRVLGDVITQLTPSERARRVAVVPQAARLPPAMLAGDVVALGRTAYLGWLGRESASDRRIIEQAMQQTSTIELANRPLGELSGGEQQRVLLARGLAQSPRLLLLDEPTAQLDLRHQDEFLGLVGSLAKEQGLSVLIALHDLNLVARFADRVALLSSGRIHKLGPPEEVLTPDDLAHVYGLAIHVMPHPLRGTPLVLPG